MSARLRKLLLPVAAALFLILGAGWTRNKLAADRQGEWVRVTRGDLVTGVDVTGTLAAVDSGVFGPPQISDQWDFKISMLAPEGSEVKIGQPVLAFDTTDLQKRLQEKSAAECPVCQKRFACDEHAMLLHLDGTIPEPLAPGEPVGYTRLFLHTEPRT